MVDITENRLMQLRQDFDHAFAMPAISTAVHHENFLFFKIMDDPYAVRITDLSTLLIARPIASMTTSVRGFKGLIGLRGDLVSVYSLPELLGYKTPTSHDRFMLLSSTHRDLCFSIPNIDGYQSVSQNDVSLCQEDKARLYTREILTFNETPRHVIAMSLVVKDIGQQNLAKERS